MTFKWDPKPFTSFSMDAKAVKKGPKPGKPKPPKVEKPKALKDFKPDFIPTPAGQVELEAQLKDKHLLPPQNTDPIWHQAKQEQAFYNSQAFDGLNILTNGLGIDTAADAQNVEIAKHEFNFQLPEEPAFTATTDPLKPEEPDPYFNKEAEPFETYSQPLRDEWMWWESAGINADHMKGSDQDPFQSQDDLFGDPMGFGKKTP